MPAPPLSVRDAAAARRSHAVPAIAQALTKRVPAQVGVDGLLVHLVRRRDDDRAVRGGLAVVQALVVDRDAEEAGRAEGDVAGVLLLDGSPDRLLALVDAEHELRPWAGRGRLLRQRPPGRQGVEDAAPIGPLVGLVQHRRRSKSRTRQALRPDARRARRRRARARPRRSAGARATPHSSEASSTGGRPGDRRHQRLAGASSRTSTPASRQARSIGARARAAAARPGSRRARRAARRRCPPDAARAARTCRPSPAAPAPWRAETARCPRRARRARPASAAMIAARGDLLRRRRGRMSRFRTAAVDAAPTRPRRRVRRPRAGSRARRPAASRAPAPDPGTRRPSRISSPWTATSVSDGAERHEHVAMPAERARVRGHEMRASRDPREAGLPERRISAFGAARPASMVNARPAASSASQSASRSTCQSVGPRQSRQHLVATALAQRPSISVPHVEVGDPSGPAARPGTRGGSGRGARRGASRPPARPRGTAGAGRRAACCGGRRRRWGPDRAARPPRRARARSIGSSRRDGAARTRQCPPPACAWVRSMPTTVTLMSR